MRVAIIGAGLAGLVNARVLHDLGAEVVVFETRADVGGVWSSTRGYPGQRLQNDKRSYSLSDFPMPEHYPEHPDRSQVQAYLADYARHHGLEDALRLSTTVIDARTVDAGWRITSDGPCGLTEDLVDWLIIANGTLSTPTTPVLVGSEAFEDAGGRVVQSSALGDAVDFAGRRVVVLGYGKSGTDIAVAAADGGAEVDVIARSAPWKLPERIGTVPFQRLVITRLGEHLLWAPYRTVAGRVLRRADTPLRWTFTAALRRQLRRQLQLEQRGTAPRSSIRELSHLVTPGFDEAVDDGRIRLHHAAQLEQLSAAAGGPTVHLSDGAVLRADLLVVATGYRTDLSFLDERTRSLLLDGRGRVPLYRHTVPDRVPHLLFAGWINSFRSPIASELQALWIGALLHGGLTAPHGRPRNARHRVGAGRKTAPSGLTILDQDAWLRDAGLSVPWTTIATELLHPLDPADYAGLHRRLQQRLAPDARPAPVDGGPPLPGSALDHPEPMASRSSDDVLPGGANPVQRL